LLFLKASEYLNVNYKADIKTVLHRQTKVSIGRVVLPTAAQVKEK